MEELHIQLQSILFNNDKADIEKAVSAMSNAASVYRQKGHALDCVLVYGDASEAPLYTAEEIHLLKQKYDGLTDIRYIVFGENTGTSKGHNRMAKDAQADYLLLMNPDIILCPNFFEEILSPFSDPAVGAAEGRQLPLEHPKDYDKATFETAWTSGACPFIRSDVFRAVGGYDAATFFMYCDDVDLAWRVRLAGYKLIYCPRAMILHSKMTGADGMSAPSSFEIYWSALANLLMSVKWSFPRRTAELIDRYSHSTEKENQDAAAAFLQMKEEGRLPSPLDPEHRVAVMYDDYYAPQRFNL